jgi:MFS family permease
MPHGHARYYSRGVLILIVANERHRDGIADLDAAIGLIYEAALDSVICPRGLAVSTVANVLFIGQAAGDWLSGKTVDRIGFAPVLIGAGGGLLVAGGAFALLIDSRRTPPSGRAGSARNRSHAEALSAGPAGGHRPPVGTSFFSDNGENTR